MRRSLSETDLAKANRARRYEISRLESEREDIINAIIHQNNLPRQASKISSKIGSLLKDFQQLDVGRQRAELSRVVKVAYVRGNNALQLDFHS